MIHCGPVLARLEEMNRIEVSQVHASAVRRGTVRAVLLHVHPKETHISTVDLFECKQCFGAVRKFTGQLTSVNKPGQAETKISLVKIN